MNSKELYSHQNSPAMANEEGITCL